MYIIGDKDKFNYRKFTNAISSIAQTCYDRDNIINEEATKTSLVIPLLLALGYSVFNPKEVSPEFTVDVGTKRGERVDYVIILERKPAILIEAKQIGSNLSNKISQLFRYFSACEAKLAILTDGARYLFFTDSKKENIMDQNPYFEINITNATKEEITELYRYSKHILSNRMVNEIKNELKFKYACDKYIREMFKGNISDFTLMKLVSDNNLEDIDIDVSKEYFIQSCDKFIDEVRSDLELSYQQEETSKVEVLNIDIDKEYILGEVNTRGLKIRYARIFGKIYDYPSYVDVFIKVIEQIFYAKRNCIEMLLNDVDIARPKSKVSILSRNSRRSDKPRKIEVCNIYMDSYAGSEELVRRILLIMKKCSVDVSNVKLKFVEMA